MRNWKATIAATANVITTATMLLRIFSKASGTSSEKAIQITARPATQAQSTRLETRHEKEGRDGHQGLRQAGENAPQSHASYPHSAGAIAATLYGRGFEVEVQPVREVRAIEGYRAVVLGSAVYDRTRLPEAVEFVRRNLDALTGLPVWMFSFGIRDALRDPIGALLKNAVPKEIVALRNAIHPCDYHIFSGVIERAQLPLAGRLIFRGLGVVTATSGTGRRSTRGPKASLVS
ncbi:MAG: hypothetical protein JOZ19_11330 [Rubrobacter sp.]|nr:hypothetical protein [Rubrobacter sp.]